MNVRTLILSLGVSIICATAAATPTQYTCEFWHPRLGQMPQDYKYALDLEAKRCRGEPCTITEKELTWSAEGGRYTITINRLTNEGQITREGELLTVLKNCQLEPGKS